MVRNRFQNMLQILNRASPICDQISLLSLNQPFGRLDYVQNFSMTKVLIITSMEIAVVIKDINDWPLSKPLPSYGHGREAPGGRFMSFIFGTNLTDVILTGTRETRLWFSFQ